MKILALIVTLSVTISTVLIHGYLYSKALSFKTIEGQVLDSTGDIPKNFQFLSSKVTPKTGLDIENYKLVAVHYPVHHTENAVVFLLFKKTTKGYRLLAESKVIDNIAANCCDTVKIHELIKNKEMSIVHFSLNNPLYIFHYKLILTMESPGLKVSFMRKVSR